jgi:TonB family protein
VAVATIADHPPRPRLTVAPVFPEGGEPESVNVVLSVGRDGAVTRASVEGDPPEPFANAALDAARRFRFDPAVRHGKPVASRYRLAFPFRLRSHRSVFPGNYADLGPRIGTLLRERFPSLVALPAVGGFLIAGEPETLGGSRVSPAVFVRAGPQDAASTWVVVSAAALTRPVSVELCDCCDGWDPQEARQVQFARWLELELGIAPANAAYLARNDETSVPSGLPEPLQAASWSRRAVGAMLLGALYPEDADDDQGAASRRPTEAELLEPARNRSLEPVDPTRIIPPVRILKVRPVYPEMARKAGVQGDVTLEALINTYGDVQDVRVKKGNPMLDEAAVLSVLKWKFDPAKVDGKPIDIWFTINVTFTLR